MTFDPLYGLTLGRLDAQDNAAAAKPIRFRDDIAGDRASELWRKYFRFSPTLATATSPEAQAFLRTIFAPMLHARETDVYLQAAKPLRIGAALRSVGPWSKAKQFIGERARQNPPTYTDPVTGKDAPEKPCDVYMLLPSVRDGDEDTPRVRVAALKIATRIKAQDGRVVPHGLALCSPDDLVIYVMARLYYRLGVGRHNGYINLGLVWENYAARSTHRMPDNALMLNGRPLPVSGTGETPAFRLNYQLKNNLMKRLERTDIEMSPVGKERFLSDLATHGTNLLLDLALSARVNGGTPNPDLIRQIVERFDLTVAQAEDMRQMAGLDAVADRLRPLLREGDDPASATDILRQPEQIMALGWVRAFRQAHPESVSAVMADAALFAATDRTPHELL